MTVRAWQDERYVADPEQPRYLCPCHCGRLLDAAEYRRLTGREPLVPHRPQARPSWLLRDEWGTS